MSCTGHTVQGKLFGGAIMSDAGKDAFARLFAESRAALRSYVRRFVRSKDTADEIVQEAFLRTYEHSASVKIPRAFLFSTARNLALDLRRHERIARTETMGDSDLTDVVSECESPESGLLSKQRSLLLREAVASLPPQCRTAFTLKVFHGCSYKEIAEKLGISTKTVEHHIARGLRETHLYLREHSAEDEER
jgi:RNA polymerase sigma-70 factor (family 1)